MLSAFAYNAFSHTTANSISVQCSINRKQSVMRQLGWQGLLLKKIMAWSAISFSSAAQLRAARLQRRTPLQSSSSKSATCCQIFIFVSTATRLEV
jgi:hypothetical protein